MTANNPSAEKNRLSRRLNLTDAVFLGLGSMIGAGVFSVIGPSAQAAGAGLLIGLFIAGGLAYLNASAMAQLAAVFPESGGTYVYGRKLLGPLPGFLAGWGFVIGKLASCTAMALTFGHYANPEFPRGFATGAVVLLTTVNCMGVRKTVFTTKLIVALVLLSLAAVIFAALGGGGANPDRLVFWNENLNLKGIFESAGLLFFAFAGYARVATLGEEILEPQKTIPRAIQLALGLTLAVYLTVILTALLTVDIGDLAGSKSPLLLAVESGGWSALSPVVRFGACVASIGVLLSLMAGISRTAFAMSANGDLPVWLSKVHPVRKVPYRAEVLVGVIVALVVNLADLRSAIGFSSFAILIYYAIANIAVLKLKPGQCFRPKWQAVTGAFGCLAIATVLPQNSVAGGVLLFAAGTAVYLLRGKLNPGDFH